MTVKYGQHRHLLAAHRIITQQLQEAMGVGTQDSSFSKRTDKTQPVSSSGKPPEQPVTAVGDTHEQADRPAAASSSDEHPVTRSLDVDHSLSTP